jgi:hypothetical protein
MLITGLQTIYPNEMLKERALRFYLNRTIINHKLGAIDPNPTVPFNSSGTLKLIKQ